MPVPWQLLSFARVRSFRIRTAYTYCTSLINQRYLFSDFFRFRFLTDDYYLRLANSSIDNRLYLMLILFLGIQ